MTRLLFALLLLPALGLAQTVDLSALPPGAQILHRHDSGVPLGTFTFFPGEDGYAVAFREGDRRDGPPDETHIYDAAGNMTEVRTASGTSYSFTPHNCVRTLGTCDYLHVFATGATRPYRRVTKVGPDGMWESRRYRIKDGEPVFIDAWFMSFAEDGLVERAERRNEAGEVTWGRTAERLWVE